MAKKGQMHSCSGNLATMACGMPYAIAAQVAFPDRQVIGVVGDGGFAMLMGESITAVAYSCPSNWSSSRTTLWDKSNGSRWFSRAIPSINATCFPSTSLRLLKPWAQTVFASTIQAGSVALRNRVDETMTGCPAAAVPGILYSGVVDLPMMWLHRVFAGISD